MLIIQLVIVNLEVLAIVLVEIVTGDRDACNCVSRSACYCVSRTYCDCVSRTYCDCVTRFGMIHPCSCDSRTSSLFCQFRAYDLIVVVITAVVVIVLVIACYCYCNTELALIVPVMQECSDCSCNSRTSVL